MKRRHVLTTAAFSISLCGCTEGDDTGTETNPPELGATEVKTPSPEGDDTGIDTNSPASEATDAKTPSPEGLEPECWPSMCEGTALVVVSVANGFSGEVVLQADCRSEEFAISSGKSVRIGRHEDGESCGVSLFVDGEQVFDENIDGYERVTLTVNASGEVGKKRVVQ